MQGLLIGSSLCDVRLIDFVVYRIERYSTIWEYYPIEKMTVNGFKYWNIGIEFAGKYSLDRCIYTLTDKYPETAINRRGYEMKVKTAYYSTTGCLVLTLTCATHNVMAFGTFGGVVDNTCTSLGYPLAPEFEPQVSNNCIACHDDGAGGGSGAGKTAYRDQNFEFFCPPPASNMPPAAMANGPYMGEVEQPISFSSVGSMDTDGSIVSFLWDFGDGTSGTAANPTHTYTVASKYTVNLTVMDDLGDTGSSNTTATITPPATNDPDINLNTVDLDFGQVEVGTTESRAALVENTGTQRLDITAIMPCSGSSTEYSWSPSSFTVSPGASQTVTATYSPVDENQDSGCLEIANNDPDENPAWLNLTGSGYVPQPQMLDIDIAGVRAGKRVSLRRVKPVAVKLVIKNNGAIDGSASASLTGTQNGVTVYNEVVDVNVTVGQRAGIKFPAYEPTAAGNIQWSVTVADEDPDVDDATAVTRVVR